MNPYNFQFKNLPTDCAVTEVANKSFDRIEVCQHFMQRFNNMGNPSQAQQPLTVTTWELKSTKKKSPKNISHI